MTTSSTDEIRATVLSILGEIAPEADLDAVKPDVDLRDQLDVDSMDLQNFLISVDETLGVDIPERDYGKLATLDACVSYLVARLQKTGTSPQAT
jgi:acyl carrier protein